MNRAWYHESKLLRYSGGVGMTESKEWDWQKESSPIWLEPCEESYYFCRRWKKAVKRTVLDLGCGLGRHIEDCIIGGHYLDGRHYFIHAGKGAGQAESAV
jgi:hypothetical protein